jgi:CRISPR-associated protein Cas5/CasD subtype I-E
MKNKINNKKFPHESGDSSAVLCLSLVGPMQSWGLYSQWDHRDTHDSPTKSGIVGILCSLLYQRDVSDAELQRVAKAFMLSIRVDQYGSVFEDYHTITNSMVINKGKLNLNKNNIITKRQYLQNCRYTAYLRFNDFTIFNECRDAVMFPKSLVGLGKKCCRPSRPLYNGNTNNGKSISDIMCTTPLITFDLGKQDAVSIYTDDPEVYNHFTEGVWIDIYDEPISFKNRLFSLRSVYTCAVSIDKFKNVNSEGGK